jgi:hypothetical protein
MQFSIENIVVFVILLVLSLSFVVKYHTSKKPKYILFLLVCICGIFNRNNMIYINGIEINNTIYVEFFVYVILTTIVILGYKLYKKKELI